MLKPRRRGVLGVLAGAVFVGGVFAGVTGATGVTVTATVGLDNEPFTDPSTAPGWVLPSPTAYLAHTNLACLTGGAGDAIPACSPSGTVSGLRLNPGGNSPTVEGGANYNVSAPTTAALDVSFNAMQYGASPNTPGDGLAFFLAASDPEAGTEASALTLGYPGGALGYAPYTPFTVDGLTHGYLGVGLDVFGTYGSQNVNGTGCPAGSAALAPQSVVVRGPGSGMAGYCILNSAHESGFAFNDEVNAAPVSVPVEVVVNPTESTITATGGFSVDPGTYAVRFTPIGGSVHTMTGALPNANTYLPGGWADATTGVPRQLTFGFSGATGSATDNHTVRNFVATAISATPPTLGVALTDNSGGVLHNGHTVTYTATPSVSAASETQPITMTDTFPAELAPQQPSGSGWNCPVPAGQTVTCTYPASSGSPVPVGALPAVNMPVVVSYPLGAAAGNTADTVSVTSADASPATAQDTDTRSHLATASALSFVTQPIDTPVNGSMVNSNNSVRHVQVAGVVTGGAVDPDYTGTVTLAFQNNPSNAHFKVGGNPVATMTATAVNGVADFSPVIIDKAGFGDTLVATATALSSTVSQSFNVVGAQSQCPAGQSCSTTTSSPAGQAVTIQGQVAGNAATITATFGGNVAPLHGCPSPPPGVLTFSGDRPKVLNLLIPAAKVPRFPVLLFCFGQPTPFTDVLLHKTTFFSTANHEYEGFLPACLFLRTAGPCVKSISWHRGAPEKAVILSALADPRLSF